MKAHSNETENAYALERTGKASRLMLPAIFARR
jgi:hypothetical protein